MATPAAPTVNYQGTQVELKPDESVLNALLRNGFAIPHSCQAGACQSCLMQADDATKNAVPSASQEALSAAERQQGLFLACCAFPTEALSATLPDASVRPTTTGEIISIDALNQQVMRVLIAAQLDYEPGQFINIRVTSETGEEIQRSYSLARAPVPGQPLELQIKLLADGQFSQWLAQEAQPGTTVTLEGPHGLCHLTDEDLLQPSLLLAGTGTGLAPLLAIIESAHQQNYSGEIHLLFANRQLQDFYCVDLLQEMAANNDNLKLHFLTQQEEASAPIQTGDVYQHLKQLPVDMSRTAVFLCGAESFVTKMRKACFLQGASMKKIRADAFVAS